MSFRFKRGTSQYLGADDEEDSEQADRPSPSSSPDKMQVHSVCLCVWLNICKVGLGCMRLGCASDFIIG